MHREIILIIISGLLFSCTLVSADEKQDVSSQAVTEYLTGSRGLVLPSEHKDFRAVLKDEVEKKEALKFLNTQIKNITYDKEGKILSVEYLSGESVDYSYKYGENNELVSVSLMCSNGVKMVISKEPPEAGREATESAHPPLKEEDGDIYITIEYPEEPLEENQDETSPRKGRTIIVIRGKDGFDLEEVASTPMEFNLFRHVKDAIDKAVSEREGAYKEYIKKTKTYYMETHKKLKTRFGMLKSEGIDLTEDFKNLSEENLLNTEGRKAVDDTVALIRADAGKSYEKKIVYEDFLTVESEQRAKILQLNEKIYEGKVAKALEYIYGIIDELLNSRLALYFSNKDEKIEVIINLPKIEEDK